MDDRMLTPEEVCEYLITEGYTKAKAIYDAYKIWCKSNGYYVCSMKKFNAELTAHPEWYDEKGVSSGYITYQGLGLKSV